MHLLQLERTVPESALFTRLVDFEKRLDAVIMRKRYDIQDALRKPAKVMSSSSSEPWRRKNLRMEAMKERK
jgi:hypothetical protein